MSTVLYCTKLPSSDVLPWPTACQPSHPPSSMPSHRSSQSLGEEEEGIPMRPLRIMNGDPERRSNLIVKE